MEFIFILLFGVYFIFLAKVFFDTPAKKSRPCNVHIWRFRDQDGWVPQDEVGTDRWRRAAMICAVCGLPPNSETSTKDYPE